MLFSLLLSFLYFKSVLFYLLHLSSPSLCFALLHIVTPTHHLLIYFPLVLSCLDLPMFICPPYIEFVFLSFSFCSYWFIFICLYITNFLCPITVICDLSNHHFPPLFTFFLRPLFSDLCHSHSGQTDHSSCHNHHCRH